MVKCSPSRSGILTEAINTKILTKNHPDSYIPTPISCIPTLITPIPCIPNISTPINHIPTLIPHIPCISNIPTPISRIPTLIAYISTLIPRVPTLILCIPTLILHVPIILLIPFPDSLFQLLQIAKKTRFFFSLLLILSIHELATKRDTLFVTNSSMKAKVPRGSFIITVESA